MCCSALQGHAPHRNKYKNSQQKKQKEERTSQHADIHEIDVWQRGKGNETQTEAPQSPRIHRIQTTTLKHTKVIECILLIE